MNPFDYVNQILYGKKNLIVDEESEKGYAPFLINRSLSYHKDCIAYANEMNSRHHLDKKLQYDFFINTVRTRKRYSPWIKQEKLKDLEVVKSYYGYSNEKAKQALRILSEDQINFIKSKLETGGRK